MCRFLAYDGPPTLMQGLLLNSAYSLVNQSRHARMRFEPINGDGVGVGWYPEHDDPEPGTFVSIEPAWSNRNLKQIAAKIRTRHFFAHVRDASEGMPVSQSNCHPFQYGPYLWMHNGYFSQFERSRRAFLATLSDRSFAMIKGNTDSEHAFAAFLDEMDRQEGNSDTALYSALLAAMTKIMTIRKAAGSDGPAHMNFAVSNGRTAVFTRFCSDERQTPPSLFYLSGDARIVASEPLSAVSEWTEVAAGEALVITQDGEIEARDIALSEYR